MPLLKEFSTGFIRQICKRFHMGADKKNFEIFKLSINLKKTGRDTLKMT